MWIALITGWILGSATLYACLIATAKEPRRPECMDCRLSDCTDCPYLLEQREDVPIRRAA